MLSLSVPHSVSGKALLQQELKKRGIPYQHLPPEFFAECVEKSERLAYVIPQEGSTKKKANFVENLVNYANMIERWRDEPNSPMFAEHGGKPNSYRVLFEKYDLRKTD